MVDTIIIGAGEIGKGLTQALSKYYETMTMDKHDEKVGCDYMHICFPYSDKFEDEVKRYQKLHDPDYIIIHSTVPVGTSRKLGAIHSPVRGIHPRLKEGIKTFVKYLGGEDASEVADYFRRADIKVYLFDKSETTELMKILSTTKYGLDIEYIKEVKRLADEYEVPFEAWTIWTKDYNKGYEELGQSHFKRPNLIPIMKRQGGHCTINNLQLFDNTFTDFVKKQNEKQR